MIATVEPIAAPKPKSVAELRQTVSASRLNTWLDRKSTRLNSSH